MGGHQHPWKHSSGCLPQAKIDCRRGCIRLGLHGQWGWYHSGILKAKWRHLITRGKLEVIVIVRDKAEGQPKGLDLQGPLVMTDRPWCV